jgi:UDP-N-acetylmuramoyl-L-alanyl-D-glutamate--2,6-diaminopimelate ligase
MRWERFFHRRRLHKMTRMLRDMAHATLAELCEDIPGVRIPASAEAVRIGRVRDDSRRVEPDDLFVAVRGTATDGGAHIADAIARGAAAVVVQEDGIVDDQAWRDERADRDVPVVRVENSRVALALLAAAAFGNPSRQIDLVGITGTVGKTSVLVMLEEILRRAGIEAGTIGSLGIRFAGNTTHNPNTTPGALVLQEALRDMADAGVAVAAMEVTSHALMQERIHGLRYDLGIFTNLTLLEHMEYHGSFRSYAEAKLRFLDHLEETAPLIHAAGDRAVNQAARRHRGPRVSCGGGGGAWVGVRRELQSLHGTGVTLAVRRPLPRLDGSCLDPCTVPLRLRTLGRPNTINATLAATAGLVLGAAPEVVQQALSAVKPPKRRLEVIRNRAPTIVDDTVGHPDSITGVFELAERVPHRELRAVFCARGMRGELINARDAEALAIWARRVHIDALHITSAEDTADERNRVSTTERRAFLRVLESESVPHSHHMRVEDAIAAALTGTADDDLVLLLGAQGMDAGASMVRRLLPAAS